jgi:predicted MFS family arabinose efflux permease
MAITFLLGVGGAMFEPASRAVLPSLVPDTSLQAANGLNTVTNRTALIIGPPAGAFLVTVFSAEAAFAVDSVTFLISVLSLLSLRQRQHRRPAQPSGRSPLSEALDGIRTVRDQPWAAAIMLQGAVQVLLVHAPLTVLAPLVLRGRGELTAYGWLLSLQTVGAIVGAVLASRWQPKEPGSVALLAMLGGIPVLVGLIAGFSLPLLALLMIFYGAGGSLFAVLWASALQRRIPDSVLGRVVSLDYIGQLGLEPVGLAVTAPFVALAGVTTVIWVSITALLVTTTAPFAVPGVRQLGAHRTDADPASAQHI